MALRHRIVRHVRVRAGDLVPHEHNARRHPREQRQALQDLYQEVGFARSLLAQELPDGRLKLLDGHLRRKMHPDEIVEVEVLDVTDDEARKLLLSLDPLAALAEYDPDTLDELRSLTETDSESLHNLWQSLDADSEEARCAWEQPEESGPRPPAKSREQYLILIECVDEASQLSLLERFQKEGLSCRALLS